MLLQGEAIVITKWVSFTTKWTRFLKYEARANKTWGKKFITMLVNRSCNVENYYKESQ